MRRVYFGHQSVGRDIIAGLEALSEEHALGLRFVQTRCPDAVSGPAFVDFLAGENANPASKNDALLRQLDARSHADGALALLKYCYVDISERTDVHRLFGDYRRMVLQVRARHPDVTLVHTTIPLTTVERGTKAWVKGAIGRPTQRGANTKRQEYNMLLRATFVGREPIYDLAAVESSGGRCAIMTKEGGVQTLSPAFTHDGGHLNDLGRRTAAAALLDVLGDLCVQRGG